MATWCRSAPEDQPGRAHAAHERRAWARNLLASLSAAATLGLFTTLAGGLGRARPPWSSTAVWTLVLAVGFVIAFRHTRSPKVDRQASTSRETRS